MTQCPYTIGHEDDTVAQLNAVRKECEAMRDALEPYAEAPCACEDHIASEGVPCYSCKARAALSRGEETSG